MELELERTYLLRELPEGFKNCKSSEIIDVYIPAAEEHPILRIRKKGDVFEITKKSPIKSKDSSEQSETTISLTKEEFEELGQLKGKRFRKIRYYCPFENNIRMELDVYLDDLLGLAMVDFEFDSIKEKNNFLMPSFCLADVTQEKDFAGGILAGKKYSDIEPTLKRYNYKKINYKKLWFRHIITGSVKK